jgi:[ribosomal protein S5]-alanine N-acetyltransferase
VALPAEVLDELLCGRSERAARLLGAEPPSWWPREERYVFELRRDQLRRDPAEEPWLVRGIVTRADPPTVVGQIGFHEPPGEDGVAELGYMVFPEHRRRGYAEEAARAMIAWAREQPGVRGVRASVAPDNEPSRRLVGKLGFVLTGSQIDEIDGLELVFDLAFEPGSPAAPVV